MFFSLLFQFLLKTIVHYKKIIFKLYCYLYIRSYNQIINNQEYVNGSFKFHSFNFG